MNVSTCLIAGLHRAATCCGCALALIAAPTIAQRVQFPTPVQPVQTTSPYNVPSTTSPYSVPATPPAATPPATTSPYSVPSTAPAPSYTPPPTYTPAPAPTYTPAPSLPATTPTYPTTPHTPSPYTVSPAPAPYNPQAVGPPPLFDPYATGSTAGPPPASLPYNYTSPPPASAFPTQPGSLYPNGVPYQWTPGTFDPATSAEGYWTKTQRFLQELSAEYTFIYGDHNSPHELEINRLELASTFAVPMFYNIDTPLLVTPGFAFNWLGGPEANPAMIPRGPDLPPRVYDAYLDFAWYPRVNEWLGAELGFRPGVWSDFDHVTTDSVRLLGRGLATVAITPQLDILFGAVYLDRLQTKLLPAGGFYWRPTPEWDAYVVFPNPKVRKLMTAVGNTKWYWYAAGEYGGGSWTIDRPLGLADQFDYNDIRVIGGLEWETQTAIRGFVEAGYVWDRDLIFRSGQPARADLNDTVMVRGGINF